MSQSKLLNDFAALSKPVRIVIVVAAFVAMAALALGLATGSYALFSHGGSLPVGPSFSPVWQSPQTDNGNDAGKTLDQLRKAVPLLPLKATTAECPTPEPSTMCI